jgi:SSS family solute:Na+ symporter
MLARIDLIIILLSLGLTVTIGLWFSRRWRGSEGFFLAGRDLTWPFIGFSLFATNISTEHFVGLAAAGHSTGLVEGGYEWIASYCLLMLALVFAPQYLRHRVYTIPEFFERRYGLEARVGLTLYFLAMIVLTKVSIAIFGGAKVIHHFTGWDPVMIMWGIGLLTAAYTMAGGLAAVIYTDFIQAILLIGGSTVLTLAGLSQAGGWAGLTEALEARNASHMLSMVRPPTDPYLPFSGYLLGNFLIGGMFYWCMDQVNVQRVLGARDLHHARRGAIFAGFLKIIPVFILVLPGVIAFVLYDGITDHNATYAVLVERLLAPGLRGVVLAALLAALMSSLSSTFNSAGTLVARDLLHRFRPETTVRAQILAGQGALLAVMVAGILCTPLVERYENIWKYLQVVTGYLSVPFAVAGLLGVLTRRINRAGAMAGVLAGIATGIFLFIDSEKELVPFLRAELLASFLHRTFLCAVVSAATMTAVSLLTPPPPPAVREGAFYLFRRVPPEAERSGAPPARGLGDYRLWAGILFVLVAALWWTFR